MNGTTPLLDLDGCRLRQERLRRRMAAESLDAVVVVTPEHVQYLTGQRWDFRFVAAAAVLAVGSTPRQGMPRSWTNCSSEPSLAATSTTWLAGVRPNRPAIVST